MDFFSSAGDKPSDSSATNTFSSSSNNRVNERSSSCLVNFSDSDLGCNIEKDSVLSLLSAASGRQSNVSYTLSNSNRKFGDFPNQGCIAPIGPSENRNVNCNDEEGNENNRRHVCPCIYDPHDIVSLDREHCVPYSYNKITIDDLMMDDPRQKKSFVQLQLLCIVSGSHDVSGSRKGKSRYTYYSRQL